MGAAPHLNPFKQPTQAIVDAIQASIAVIDRHGDIVCVNHAWRSFARDNGDPDLIHTGIGANYLMVLERAVAADATLRPIHEGIQSVLNGRAAVFTMEYPCHTADVHRWFKMVASPLDLADGGVVLAHHDITDLHAAQTEREELIAELSARNALLE